MTLIAYFDSSETKDYLTLACFIASRKTWTLFDKEWKKTLKSSGAPESKCQMPYFHSREAFHHRGGYKGWDDKKVFDLASMLYKVISYFSYSNKNTKFDLLAYATTIKLSDYNALIEKGIRLRDSKILCLDHCFCAATCHPSIQLENNRYLSKLDLLFDQKESYLSKINKIRELKGKQQAYWVDLVDDIRPVDMKENCGIQAADMLAWAANRYHSQGFMDKWGLELPGILFSSAVDYHFLDMNTLISVYDEDGNYRKNSKPPDINIKINAKEIWIGDIKLFG
jgi:hypothetical protein